MRQYPADSPRAAARVVALLLVADGAVSRSELDVLMRLRIHERLQLDPVQMKGVFEDLARDLFEFGASWDCSGGLHPIVVSCALDDVTDPELRRVVLDICHAVAQADCHLAEAECAMLAHALHQWPIPSCEPA